MKKKLQEKGITLIALVITIIVLLILAGVSINLLLGQNGIISKAKEAKMKTEIASIKEQIQTDLLSKEIQNEGSISDDSLKEILEKYGTLSEEENLLEKTLTTNKGKYEIKVSDIYSGTTVKDEQKEPPEEEPTTVANAPDTSGFNSSNTYYVAWDLTSSPYTIQESNNLTQTAPSNWYDYTEGVNHWANIKTIGGENDCYWVWIPRYAYKVPTKSSTAETIEVKFLQGTSNIPIGETEAITNTTPTPGTWVVHPAFTNAGNGGFGELTGIWVSKYEASSNSPLVVENPTEDDLEIDGGSDTDIDLKVRVKPNVTSWRNITVDSIFTVCKNLTTSGNSLEGTTGIDSHMMKNTEWGAVAYLSRSVYGKNSAVWNNPYYNNTTNYSIITGLAGNSQDYTTTTYNDTNTYKYNETGGGNASTTGNVYGVYDMAGGAWEYIAGYLEEVLTSNSTSRINSQSLYNAANKYKDKYAGTSATRTENYSANSNKYGDAMYETSTEGTGSTSWDGDDSNFVESTYPVSVRGGCAYGGENAGEFTFDRSSGVVKTNHSFRPCVVCQQ